MFDLPKAISDNKQAVEEFTAAASSLSPAQWSRPIEEGKWNPAQQVEHIALSYEESSKMLAGTSDAKPLPAPFRLLLRVFFCKAAVRRGSFRKGFKSPPPLRPIGGATGGRGNGAPADLISRVRKAAASLETEMSAQAQAGKKEFFHPLFGTISFGDYLKFQAIHTLHHKRQLPWGGV